MTINNSKLGSNGNYSFYSNDWTPVNYITFNNCTILNTINNRAKSHRIININNRELV